MPGRVGGGGEKGTEERLDTRKITCAVYYAFPCNGSIIRVFAGGDPRGAIAPRLFALFLTFSEQTGRVNQNPV